MCMFSFIKSQYSIHVQSCDYAGRGKGGGRRGGKEGGGRGEGKREGSLGSKMLIEWVWFS